MQTILMAQLYGGRGGMDEGKATFTMGDVAKTLTSCSEEAGEPVTLENAHDFDGLVDLFCAVADGPLSTMMEPCWGDYDIVSETPIKKLFDDVLAGEVAIINCEECSYVFMLDNGAESRKDAMRLVRQAWFAGDADEKDEDGWD